MLFELRDVDVRFYRERLADFLPRRIVDCHTHVWLREFQTDVPVASRGPTWPRRVADQNPLADLEETYRLLLPGHEVTPVVFGMPERDYDLDRGNAYAAAVAAERGLPALLMNVPEWTADELTERLTAGRFIGLKPYLNRAPAHIPSADITIYDFMPPHHWEAADAGGWFVILHIPRPARLRDAVNLAQLLEIDRRYPNARVVVAHLGRAYCPEDLGDALEVLSASKNLRFDFSANTNAYVMEQALRTFGAARLLFGSDLPILRMRMRRICENGAYVNLVPPGLYGDVSDDSHMREVTAAEGEELSFFFYEELWAFRCAARAVGLTAADIEDVFYNNFFHTLGRAAPPASSLKGGA